ncbi:UNKNOWN [Stylonychia lemnae]|uniref:Protein kinase domain-containing protein n=1 Tax=Stylonychia lemnae TaxID=5949 RepID=A0A078A2F9_STYLE|nr:UNKNOWN [Stylonychia lemnae]|eukprot:CDW76310.1 UNKNOWN [Stylonychia lemnae]
MGQLQVCCENKGQPEFPFDQPYKIRRDFLGIKTHPITLDYTFEGQLGLGSYGQVWLGKSKLSKGQYFAIKKIPINDLDQEQDILIQNEIATLAKCDHSSIVSVYAVYKEIQNTYIIEEYQQSYLTNFNHRFIPNCKPISYFTNASIDTVRSQTPRNQESYFSKCQEIEEINIKIIDFGFAKISKPNKRELKDILGTPYYMAPEIINQQSYGSEVDIWSVGVLLFYLIEFDFPFKGNDKIQLFKNIVKLNYSFINPIWSQVSDNCKDFIRQCFTQDQNKRPSAQQLLQHPWISQKKNLRMKKYRRKSEIPLPTKDMSDRDFENMRLLQVSQSIFQYVNQTITDQAQLNNLARYLERKDKKETGYMTVEQIKTYLTLKVDSNDLEDFKSILNSMSLQVFDGQIDYENLLVGMRCLKNQQQKQNLVVSLSSFMPSCDIKVNKNDLYSAFETKKQLNYNKFIEVMKKYLQEIDSQEIPLEELLKIVDMSIHLL